jgi:5-methylcytosine-specific restriction endonuclease McrA
MANSDYGAFAFAKPLAPKGQTRPSNGLLSCSTCGVVKPTSGFYFRGDRGTYFQPCRTCAQSSRKRDKQCVGCGRTFTGDSDGKFCSKKCAGEAASAKAKSKRLQATAAWLCKQCGKPSTRDMSAATLWQRQYCSKKCEGLGTRKPRALCATCQINRVSLGCKFCSIQCSRAPHVRPRKDRQCPQCSVTFLVKSGDLKAHKFCSLKCARAAIAVRPQWKRVKCAACGSAFRRTEAAIKRLKGGRVFCSLDCSRGFLKGTKHALYRGGADPNRGCEWLALARQIRERDEFQCQRCGRTQAENRQKLSVDHIVPWRTFADKAEANHPTNLVSLCRRCHAIKTVDFERKWLKGDRIGMEQYRRSLKLKPLFAVAISEART